MYECLSLRIHKHKYISYTLIFKWYWSSNDFSTWLTYECLLFCNLFYIFIVL